MPCCHDNHNTVIELAMQRRAAFSWAGQKAMRSLRSRSLRSRDALHLSSTVIELAMQRRAAFSWAGQKAMRSLRSRSLRSRDALHLSSYCERSELSSLFNARIFYIILYICLYISGRTSCRKCSKCFYVYLNIRPVRYSARIESVPNARRQNCSST